MEEKRKSNDILLPGDSAPPPTEIADEELSHITNWFDCLRSRQQPHATVHHGGSIFTPYGLKQTLVVPGTLGGGNWSGASFDASRGYLIANVNELGAVGALEPEPTGSPEKYRRNDARGEYARFWDEKEKPCQKPPWGTLNAVDINAGEIVWKTPLGGETGLREKTGSPNLGGSMVANGVVFIAATADSRLRAFDEESGQELWSAELEANAHATPATYLGKKTGKQFVVIAAGGGGFFHGKTSDTLAAYALADP